MFNPHVRETPKSNLAWHCITIPLVETILNPYFCWSRMVTRLLILAFPHVFPSLDHLSPLYKFPSLDQNHLFPPIFTGKGEKRKKVETCPPQKKNQKTFFPAPVPGSDGVSPSGTFLRFSASTAFSSRQGTMARQRSPFSKPGAWGGLKNLENPYEKWHLGMVDIGLWMFMALDYWTKTDFWFRYIQMFNCSGAFLLALQ